MPDKLIKDSTFAPISLLKGDTMLFTFKDATHKVFEHKFTCDKPQKINRCKIYQRLEFEDMVNCFVFVVGYTKEKPDANK